jgi:hypothetical protein
MLTLTWNTEMDKSPDIGNLNLQALVKKIDFFSAE